jgi:hypothetical protein
MPEIAVQVVEPRDRARVAVAIFRQRDAAERAVRGAHSLLRAHAASAVFVFEQREMSVDLSRKVIFGDLRPKYVQQTK